MHSSQSEFVSRHSLEWKFLLVDHRAPPIIGIQCTIIQQYEATANIITPSRLSNFRAPRYQWLRLLPLRWPGPGRGLSRGVYAGKKGSVTKLETHNLLVFSDGRVYLVLLQVPYEGSAVDLATDKVNNRTLDNLPFLIISESILRSQTDPHLE